MQPSLHKHSHNTGRECVLLFLLVLSVSAVLSICGFPFAQRFAEPANPMGTGSFRHRTHNCPWKLANISFTVTEKLINEVLSVATPTVERAIQNITVPPQQVEHADVDSMELVNFTLRNLSLHLAAPSAPYMTAEAIGMSVDIGETNFTAHVMLSTCKGVFWATMSNMTLQMPLRLRHFDNGTLYTEVSDATLVDGNFTVDHRLDSSFCRVAESVIELFMGEINAMVERKTIEALQQQLPQSVEAQLNEQLREAPLFFYVDPLIAHDKIMVTADLIPGRTDLPTSTASLLPARDVAIEVPEETINNYLDHLRCREALEFRLDTGWTTDKVKDVFPTLATLCPQCALDAMVSGNAGSTEVRFGPSMDKETDAKTGVASLATHQLQFGIVMRAPSLEVKRTVQQALARTLQFPKPRAEEMSLLDIFFSRPTSEGRTSAATDIPLIILEVNMTVPAEGLQIVGAKADHVALHINYVEEFDVGVLASNIGPLDAQALVDLENLVNRVLIPLLNAGSPYDLGPAFRRAILDFSTDSVVLASDVVVSPEWEIPYALTVHA